MSPSRAMVMRPGRDGGSRGTSCPRTRSPGAKEFVPMLGLSALCRACSGGQWIGILGYLRGPGLVQATVRFVGFSRRTDVAVAVSHHWAVRFLWHGALHC